jgi:protein arginine N-methyltransferase 3
MLDSVLSARTRFLAPTGLMVPSQCSILLSLYDASSMIRDRVEFWDDVYGFKMESMKEGWSDDGVIDVVSGEGVRSGECVLKDVHTQTVTVPELDFETTFELIADRKSTIHAFLGKSYRSDLS